MGVREPSSPPENIGGIGAVALGAITLITASRRRLLSRSKVEEVGKKLSQEERVYQQQFRRKIEVLKRQVSATTRDNLNKLPGYLGIGGAGVVFGIEIKGKKYAVKILLDQNGLSDLGKQENLQAEAEALKKGKGIPNSSQLVAYSLADHALVMNWVPGKNVSEIPLNTASPYSDLHIEKLIRTLILLDQAGLETEPLNPDNFLYDSKTGLHVVDYHAKTALSLPLSLRIDLIILTLSLRKEPPTNSQHDLIEAYYRSSALLRLAVRVQSLTILKRDFPSLFIELKEKELENYPPGGFDAYLTILVIPLT